MLQVASLKVEIQGWGCGAAGNQKAKTERRKLEGRIERLGRQSENS
jgi:hypothetical protein